MSSLGGLELLGYLLGGIAYGGYLVAKAIVKGIVFVGTSVYKYIKKHQDEIKGLSAQMGEAYTEISHKLNESADALQKDFKHYEADFNVQKTKFINELDAKDETTRSAIINSTCDAVQHLEMNLENSIKSIDQRVDRVKNDAVAFYDKHTKRISQAMNDVANFKASLEEKVDRATALATVELNDAMLLLENLKNDDGLTKFVSKGTISFLESQITSAKSRIDSGNFAMIQSAIISLNSASKDILKTTIDAHRDMEVCAVKASEFETLLKTAKNFLKQSRYYEDKKGGKIYKIDLSLYVSEELNELFKSINNAIERVDNLEKITDEDVAYAQDLFAKSTKVMSKAVSLAQAYSQKRVLENILLHGTNENPSLALTANGFEFVGATTDPTQCGFQRKLKLHNEMDKRDIVIDLNTEMMGTDAGVKIALKIFHGNGRVDTENEVLNNRYQTLISDILKKAGVCNKSFTCCGHIENNTTTEPVDVNEANVNFTELERRNREARQRIKNTNDAMYV